MPRILFVIITIGLLNELVVRLDLIPILIMVDDKIVVGIIIAVAMLFLFVTTWLAIRRRTQFSLATILLFVLVIAWPVARTTREASQERSLAAARQDGLSQLTAYPANSVTLYGRYTDGVNDHAVQVWLTQLIAKFGWMDPNEIPHEIAFVDTVDLSNTAFGDADLPMIMSLKSMRRLDLSATLVTDDALTEIANLQSLREIDLYKTGISSAALDRLRLARPDLRIVTD